MNTRFLIQPSADPRHDPRLFLHDTQQIFKTPFCVDFTPAKIQMRIKKNKKKPEAFIRACGISQTPVTYLDLTAGFGLDSFLFASFNKHAKLTLLENNPIIFKLLTAGFEHAQLFFPDMTTRCRLIHENHVVFLKYLITHNIKYDVIYLDPMFPIRTKSSRVKKYAELLQLLTQADPSTDLSQLLPLAHSCANNRVIIKRPKTAAILEKPTFSLLGARGQSCRFDVYLR